MAKVLVTGGAGYIGSVLTPVFLKYGHEVTVIDNFRYNQNSLLDCCYYPRFTIVRGDARDKNLMAKYLAGADVILPLACLVGAPICKNKPNEAKTVNLEAIKLLIRLRSKEQMIIFPTTNSGYGLGSGDMYCTEETPLKPISLYGRLKVEAEKRILDAGNSIALRLATVFGISPRMRLDLLVNDFVWRAVNDGYIVLFQANFKRNYIHIRDVVRAFLHCMWNSDSMKNEVYNVGLSDANLSKIQLCEEIKKQIPKFYFVEAEVYEDPDKRNYIVSNEKIEKTWFKPKVSLQEGIAELIKGYTIIKRSGLGNV